MNWHNALPNDLWEDRVTPKASLGTSPFYLVYDQKKNLLLIVLLPSLQLSQASREIPSSTMQNRIDTLIMLDEEREQTKKKFAVHEQVLTKWFDKHKVWCKDFDIGQLVLKWDKSNEQKGKHTKFQHLWLGPYQISQKLGTTTYRLQSIQGDLNPMHVNGRVFKKYFS